MSTLKASEIRALVRQEEISSEDQVKIDAYKTHLATIGAKSAAGQKINDPEAGLIRVKGEDVDQVELVALNHFDHGIPGTAKKQSINNSNVSRDRWPHKGRKSDARQLIESNAELKASIDALIAQLKVK